MWYYVTPANSRLGYGSPTFEEYQQKIKEDADQVERLSFELEQKGIRFKPEYSDSVWIRARDNREFSVITFLLLKHDCKIDCEITGRELKEVLG